MTKVSPLPAIEYDNTQQRKVLEKFDMKRDTKALEANLKQKKQFLATNKILFPFTK